MELVQSEAAVQAIAVKGRFVRIVVIEPYILKRVTLAVAANGGKEPSVPDAADCIKVC